MSACAGGVITAVYLKSAASTTAVLATGLMLSALLCMAVGLVLDTVTRGRREMKLLAYLSHRAPSQESSAMGFRTQL